MPLPEQAKLDKLEALLDAPAKLHLVSPGSPSLAEEYDHYAHSVIVLA
ncbi:hypothetical protein ABIE58_000634 [Roseovarius sp. MBR-78]|jgi:hypothetical protein